MNLLKTVSQKVYDRYLLYRYIFPFIKKNKNREITSENTICLFSFPRSGSTWFSELLLTLPNSCLFDEPLIRSPFLSKSGKPNLKFRKIKGTSSLDFYHFQPIPPNATWPEAFNLFEHLLKGQTISIGLYDEYGLKRLGGAGVFIVKFNYANLLYQWLTKQFNFTSIFLVRNPYSVVASLIKHPFFRLVQVQKDGSIAHFRYNELFQKHSKIFRKVETIEEFYTFFWCLNMLHGPKKASLEDSIVVFYEDLILRFEEEIHRLFGFLNRKIPMELWARQFVASKSTLNKLEITNDEQLNNWRVSLDNSQKKRIAYFLDYFEIDLYHPDLTPNPNFSRT